MPCEPITEKGKIIGWMCRRSRGKPKPPPCYKCGKPSTKLCDYRNMSPHYETDRRGNKMRKVFIPSIYTCDTPMCDDCATHAGEDTDYCEIHSSEIARARSAEADRLYKEQLKRLGIEEEP